MKNIEKNFNGRRNQAVTNQKKETVKRTKVTGEKKEIDDFMKKERL